MPKSKSSQTILVHTAGILLGCFGTLAIGFAQTASTVALPSGLTTATDTAISTERWIRNRVIGGATTGITTDYPNNGNGSVYLNSPNDQSAANWTYLPLGGLGALRDIDNIAYEWYRDDSSTVPAHLHPVLQLVLGLPGDSPLNPTLLIFERAYNPSVAAVPENTWVSESITDSSVLWRSNTPNPQFQCDLGDYKNGNCGAHPEIDGATPVLGIAFGMGRGWNGHFEGAVDSVQVGNYRANFEIATAPTAQANPIPVPTLTSAGLLAFLAGGILALTRRRRHSFVTNASTQATIDNSLRAGSSSEASGSPN